MRGKRCTRGKNDPVSKDTLKKLGGVVSICSSKKVCRIWMSVTCPPLPQLPHLCSEKVKEAMQKPTKQISLLSTDNFYLTFSIATASLQLAALSSALTWIIREYVLSIAITCSGKRNCFLKLTCSHSEYITESLSGPWKETEVSGSSPFISCKEGAENENGFPTPTGVKLLTVIFL